MARPNLQLNPQVLILGDETVQAAMTQVIIETFSGLM
jgi:hypothetical protein